MEKTNIGKCGQHRSPVISMGPCNRSQVFHKCDLRFMSSLDQWEGCGNSTSSIEKQNSFPLMQCLFVKYLKIANKK